MPSAACPAFTTAPVFSYPAYRSAVFPASTTAISRLHVIAPWDARLGYTYSQAASPPNAVAAPTVTADFDDLYVQDLLTPATTSGATNAILGRWTECCVEIVCSQALSTAGGTIRLMKWPYGAVPALNGLAPEFQNVCQAILEQPDCVPKALAEFVSAKCLHTAMRDRTAIEFVPMAANNGNWTTVYGSTANTLTATSMAGVPFTPICILVTGATTSEYVLTVRGNIDIVPAFNSSFWRLAKLTKVPSPAAESAWWQRQRKLENMMPVSLSSQKYGRTSEAFLGIQAEVDRGETPKDSSRFREWKKIATDVVNRHARGAANNVMQTAGQRMGQELLRTLLVGANGQAQAIRNGEGRRLIPNPRGPRRMRARKGNKKR